MHRGWLLCSMMLSWCSWVTISVQSIHVRADTVKKTHFIVCIFLLQTYERFMDGCKWSIDWLILRACVCAAAHLHAEVAPVSIPMAFSLCIYLSVIVSVHAVNLSYTNLTCFSAAANTQTHTHTSTLSPPPLVTDTRPLIGAVGARHTLFPSNRALVNQ